MNATQGSFVTFQMFHPEPVLEDRHSDRDVEMGEADMLQEDESSMEKSPASEHLIIGVDFGTTFSSVAYTTVNKDSAKDPPRLVDIKCISNYPDNRHVSNNIGQESSREDVPTELWYNLAALKDGRPCASHTSSTHGISTGDSEIDSELDGEYTDDDDKESYPLLWGFGVQKHLRKMDIPKDGTTRLTCFKLMLENERSKTAKARDEILPVFKKLKKRKVIRGVEDLIRDYLEQLFIHTKAELQGLKLINDNTAIELVLSVPAVWPSKACRIMQTAMLEAVRRSGLGTWTNDTLDNLFIISEPEAAAACVLAEDNNDIYVSYMLVAYSLLNIR